jgi:hypothetical protein
VRLLPILKQLLDENLRRYRAFREEAKATGGRNREALSEARMPHTHEYQRAFLAINAPETAVLMREYLPDMHFGELAAQVLAAQWTAANEPKEDSHFRSGVDFSRVQEKRSARASDPAATSAEAEAIFSVVDALSADGATEDERKHAVALGIVAARLPHGQRAATVEKLLSMAKRRSRAALLQNLVLSGEGIDIEMVKTGIAEVFESAKTQTWILSEGGYEPKEWLRLLPFASRPAEALATVRSLPDDQRRPEFLEEMVSAFGAAPGEEAENVLFQLAEGDPRFFANHSWLDAVMRRGTPSAARRFVGLAALGAFDRRGIDRGHIARQLADLIHEHPPLRSYMYDVLRNGAASPGLDLLAQAISENPDQDGLLLLVEIEMKQQRSLTSWRTVQACITQQIPSEDWKGMYNVVPVPAAELRRNLLAMTTDGSPTDAAARCLSTIDEIRDEHGGPVSEPRHPDLEAGKPWPIFEPGKH